jgi:hypothetical protein
MRTARQGLRHAAGELVDIRVREHLKQNGEADYGRAMAAVLAADPALRAGYLYGVARGEGI